MPNFLSEAQIERALLQSLQHRCGCDVLDTELFRRKNGDVFDLMIRLAARGVRWAA